MNRIDITPALMQAAKRRALELRAEALDAAAAAVAALVVRAVHGAFSQGPWRTRKSRGDSAGSRHSPRRAPRARASSAV